MLLRSKNMPQRGDDALCSMTIPLLRYAAILALSLKDTTRFLPDTDWINTNYLICTMCHGNWTLCLLA